MALNCATGKPCGNTCISKSDTCTLDAQTAKVLDKLIKGASVPRVNNVDKVEADIAALDKATTLEERREVARNASLRLHMDTLKEIEGHMGAFGDSDASKGVYELPGMKRRSVSDEQVDAAWDNLTTQDRDLLFSPNAGAPDRGFFNLRETEWDKDTDRMRRSMLKAMLEQTDDDGNIIDPWTGKALNFPADLDHIKPIAQGGGHGGLIRGAKNSGYESANWVWISPEVNRYYKLDNDVHETYREIKKHLNEGEAGYNDAMDKTIADLDGPKRNIKNLVKQTEQGILAHFGLPTDPGIAPMLPRPEAVAMFSKPEHEAIVKAMDKAGILDNRANLRSMTYDQIKEFNKEVLTAIRENTSVAAAGAVALSSVATYGTSGPTSGRSPKTPRVETNKAIKEIMKTKTSIDDLTDAEMHRVMDRILKGRPGDTMASDVRSYLNRAPRLPLKRMSLAPWAMVRVEQKIPDVKALTPEKKKRIWDYLQLHLEK